MQVVGVINAYAAILAEKSGFKAIYLSGAGVANASYGVPDVGFTTLDDVRTLKKLGLAGCIVGRALYEGRLDLKQAIAITVRG